MTKDEAELANWAAAHNWAAGLALEYAGVALDDVMTYQILSTFNRLALQYMEELEKPRAGGVS